MPSKAWIQDFSSLLHRMSIRLHRLIGNPFLTLQNNFNNDFSTICTGLWCFDPDTTIASCKLVVPFDYTTCGTGKVSTRGDWLVDWLVVDHLENFSLTWRGHWVPMLRFTLCWAMRVLLRATNFVTREICFIHVWEGYCYNLGPIFVEARMEHPTLCVHAIYL